MGRVVVGRHAELGSLRTLIRDACAGRGGGVLTVVGPPGIGKSLLLTTAAAEAVECGAEVLRLVGVETERDLPFAGLSALLGPSPEGLGSLTETQERALSVALGRTEGAVPGRMVLGGAVLGVLSARAERRPLVALVDDLQWVDRPSAETILFVARRLQAERVAVVIASRPAEPRDADGLGRLLRSVPSLTVAGLVPVDCHRLLPEVAWEVTAALAERTGGNPLAMLEAATLLAPDVLAGVRQLPRALPPTSASEAYRVRMGSLPVATRDGCRLLAHAGRAPGDLVVLALAKLSILPADLEPLEQTGLGCLTEQGAQWRHPLVRSVAAEGTTKQIRRAHAALADCWEPLPGSRPRWAWHRAQAAPAPDEDVARALAAVARESAGRAAFLEAADAWERAAELGEDPHLRRTWLGLAARAAFQGGAAARAGHLYDVALKVELAGPEDEPTAVLLHERGRVEHALGRPSTAYALLMEATRSGGHERRVWAAAEAVYAGMYARRPDLAQAAAVRAVAEHDPHDPTQRFLALHAEGAAASLSGDHEAARQRMRTAITLLLDERLLDQQPELLLWAVNADLFLKGPAPPLHPSIQAALAQMRESGELMWSPRVVRLAGVGDYVRGSWDRAYAAFDEAIELSRLSGQRTQLAEALLLQAAVEAARGQRELCSEHTEEAHEIVGDLEVRWLADEVWETRGLMNLTLGDPQAAVDCYRRCLGISPDGIVGLVEALLLSGRGAEAQDAVDACRRSDGEAAVSIARCLMADDAPAAHLLLDHAEQAGSTFESARWRYLAGSMLRRAGARREARQQLRVSAEVFARLRTTAWLDRVQSELRASGTTLRADPETGALTAGELRVATLVAQGRSNKEVAAALFLSTKTVEFHLGRAFRKLSVTNRTALAARLAEQLSTEAPAPQA